jgi:hypothetical protein
LLDIEDDLTDDLAELEEFLGSDGYLPGERLAAEQALGNAADRRDEKIDYFRDRGGIRSGPRSHFVRGGNEGFVEIEPTRREWSQWAAKMEEKADRFDEQQGQPEPPEETFRERYWRENGHKWKRETEPDLVNAQGERIRLREDAILEQPRENPTPEQVSALDRLAARLARQRKSQSAQARAQKRDADGRFIS